MSRFKALLVSIGLAAALFAPATAYGSNVFDNLPCDQAPNSPACQDTGGEDPITGTNGVLDRVSRILAVISAIAAIFIMIIAGLIFITARGDSNRASQARDTILYAAIGLAIILLARTIIAYVLTNI